MLDRRETGDCREVLRRMIAEGVKGMNLPDRSDLADMLLWALAAAAITLVFAGVLDALDLLL